MKIINEKDVKAIDDICGPLKELYMSKNLSLATVIIKAGKEAHLHKHPELEEVYYVMSGKGKMQVEDKTYDIKIKNKISEQGYPSYLGQEFFSMFKFLR